MQQSLVVPMQRRMISKSWHKCGQEEQLTHEKSTVVARKLEVNAENTANTVEARSVSWLAHSTEEWKKKLAKLWYEKNCGYFVVRSVEFRPNGGLTLVNMCKKIVIHGCRKVLIAFCALYFLWGCLSKQKISRDREANFYSDSRNVKHTNCNSFERSQQKNLISYTEELVKYITYDFYMWFTSASLC